MSDISRSELNGLGERVSKIERMEPRVLRNENDIQDLWKTTGEIQKGFNNLTFKLFAMIAVPTLLVLYQIMSK